MLFQQPTRRTFLYRLAAAALIFSCSTAAGAALFTPLANARQRAALQSVALADVRTKPPTEVRAGEKAPEASFGELLAAESLGEFKIGSSAASVLKILGPPAHKTPPAFSEHDARYHQSWHYPQKGIFFGLVADNQGDEPKVDAIRITAPATLATRRGIRLGAAEAAVVKAYGPDQDADSSVPNERLVAGSIYGGLIFTFREGRVVEIFLGAAAE